jgi:hypothetical protein
MLPSIASKSVPKVSYAERSEHSPMADEHVQSESTSGTGSHDLKETMSSFALGGAIGLDIAGRVLWVIVAVMSVLGLLYFFYSRYTATQLSAVQICQLAAESLTMAVIPYVIARAWDEVCRPGRWHYKE